MSDAKGIDEKLADQWESLTQTCLRVRAERDALLDCAKKALDTFNDAATTAGLLGHHTMAQALLIAATHTATVIAEAEGR